MILKTEIILLSNNLIIPFQDINLDFVKINKLFATRSIAEHGLGFMLNLNDTSKQVMKKLISFITNHKHTIYITIAIGQYDLEFEMMEKTHEDFHSLLNELKNTFPGLIKNYFTVVFYHEPKVGQLAFDQVK